MSLQESEHLIQVDLSAVLFTARPRLPFYFCEAGSNALSSLLDFINFIESNEASASLVHLFTEPSSASFSVEFFQALLHLFLL